MGFRFALRMNYCSFENCIVRIQPLLSFHAHTLPSITSIHPSLSHITNPPTQNTNQPSAVKKGDRVAQMILERICMAPVVEVDALPETARYVQACMRARVVSCLLWFICRYGYV